MCFRLQHVKTPPPPPPDCNNQLSPHGGNSDHKRQRQQRNQGERELAACRSDPSVAVVLVPLGPVSFPDSRRLCRVGGGVASGFVVGGGVGPVTWPIIIVPFTVISAPWATALLTWNKKISDWWMDVKKLLSYLQNKFYQVWHKSFKSWAQVMHHTKFTHSSVFKGLGEWYGIVISAWLQRKLHVI